MKLLLLTVIIAAVASSPLTPSKNWPWQVGKEYHYDVDTYTWTRFENSNRIGNAFKAHFIIRVLAPGHLIAELDKPLYAQVQTEIKSYKDIPSDLKYQPIQITEEPFELFLEGGRVQSFHVPSSLTVTYENLIKGLISALQVDLSTYGHVHSFPNTFDKDTFQGLFKKLEADVTGDCETLYSVSPLSAEWHRELPTFTLEEDPIEITKSKNYGSCQKRVAFDFGVPEGALWNGIAYDNEEKQFIKHTSDARLLVGKQGTIYKSETMNSVFVSPLLFGTQKAEVFSYVKAYLARVEQTSDAEWVKSKSFRHVDSLLFSISESMFYPKDQNIENAQKLLQEMTPMLQTPNNLPKADFLSKFIILVRIIASLNSEQLTQLTSSVEIAKSSKNIAKSNMWIIYRDAVAQAGTDVAFEQIKSWILTKNIQGEEAASLIAAISSSLRYPTKKVITDFFNLAINPEVTVQKFLNNSALLATTKLYRFLKDDLFVVNTVIPHLSKELKEAVENGDSNKAQVYVRVLGNLAHKDILSVFAPYLNGSIAVTKYLRIQIVASLKTLANLKNEHVRAVLYSILRNTAEPYEVRVMAALNIFMAFPTAEMMQVLAQMTHEDPSTQVRAVLANSINFAAGLKDPRFAVLAKTAQSVKDVIAKEKFGYRYSTDSMIDEDTSEDDIAFFRELSYIGSEDYILPVYQRSALRARGTGWTEESQVTLSVSGMQQILEYISKMVYGPNKDIIDFKYSAKKIAEILNIKREPRAPLEGALFIDGWKDQKLFTFNQEDLTAFITSTMNNMEQLLKGFKMQYTKVLNAKQVLVVFPLAAGVPFFFEYIEPIVISINGSVQLKFDKSSLDFAGSLNKQFDITYARNLDGSVGFLDTIGEVYASTGVVNKIQFNIPVRLNTVVNPGDTKLHFVLPEQDANIVHLSVWPYTSLQKTDSLITVSENPTTKLIERPAKVFSTDYKSGYLTGVVCQLQGYTYSTDYKDTTKLFDDANILESIGTLLYQKDVALTHFNFKYLLKETKNKEISFTVFYDTLYNQEKAGELTSASLVKDVSPEGRREEISKRAASGIDSAKVQLYDFSVIFDGQKKVEYVLTTAFAKSFVDNKVQGALFFNGFNQINAIYRVITPKVTPLNFKEALENKIKVTYEADLKYGNSDNLQLKGYGERSDKYTNMLSNDPMAKQCLRETSKNNFYQKDCYKMIIKAHAPDFFKGTLTYKQLTDSQKNMTTNTHNIFNQLTFWKQLEDTFKITEDGKIEIEAQYSYNDKNVNYELRSKHNELRVNNLKGTYYGLAYLGLYWPYAMAFYEPITAWERSRNWFTGYQNLPYCAVDDNKVWTFSGRSYDYSLTGSWHVVMVDESNDVGKYTDLVILARRPNEKQEEVYVSYKTVQGKYVELEIKPTAVEVKSNTEKVSEGALTTYRNVIDKAPLLQYYTLADGILVFNINNGALRLIYDSQRLIIFTDNHRSTTRGICGQSTTQTSDDYMTPWGLVYLPEYYGASFSLDGDFSDPKTVELKKEAKLKAYQPVTKYTNILKSDTEWSKAENDSTKGL